MNDQEAFLLSQLLSTYIRKELTAEEKAQLQEILEKYPEKRKLINRLEDSDEIKQRIERMDSQDLDDAWKQILKKYRNKTNYSTHKQKFTLRQWLPYAAAVLLVLAVGLLINRNSPDNGIVKDEVYGFKNDVLPGKDQAILTLSDGRTVELGNEYQEIREENGVLAVVSPHELSYAGDEVATKETIFNTLSVPKSGFFKLILPDGSKVWINALSKLRFPVAFAQHERKVYITGEAYFEVKKDLNRPFKVVVSDNREVIVLGTSFNVNTYEQQFITTLVEGSVRIKNGAKENILAPGQEADASDASIHIQDAVVEKAVAWKDGYFYFKRDKIYLVLDQLARWYDLELKYVGKIPESRLSGSIKRDVKLSEVLAMLKDVSPLHFEIDGRTLIIKDPATNKRTDKL